MKYHFNHGPILPSIKCIFKKETSDFQHEILEIINHLTYGCNSQTNGHRRNEDYDHLHFSPLQNRLTVSEYGG